MSKGSISKLKAYTRRVTRGQSDAACFLQLWSDKMRDDPGSEPMPIVQLGYAMILDKPIVIVAPIGARVPENIIRAARAVEYYHPDDPASLHAATLRALAAAGLDVEH